MNVPNKPNDWSAYPDAKGRFGDYGGLILKILWAILDIATIVILISGLYLWLAKRRKPA